MQRNKHTNSPNRRELRDIQRFSDKRMGWSGDRYGGHCGLTEKETSVTVEEGEKAVKASQRR